MRKILILGAGRSASSLIRYLIEHSGPENWRITVADRSATSAEKFIAGSPNAHAETLDASQPEARASLISDHDIVVSMLPATMHMEVVRDCIRSKKPVITPSYVPDEMWALDGEAKKAGVLILNEMGLDPGIDHMSAMRILDGIRAKGAQVSAFESYTGGLVAPASDTNPWGYKFTWNPRNVVLAGQGGAARFLRDGWLRFIPYHRLFTRYVNIEVEGYGAFDGYANRDSLKYRKHYGLEHVKTLIRGTLRRNGFCDAWNALVQLGCTDDTYTIPCQPDTTWSTYFERFLPPTGNRDVRVVLAEYLSLEIDGAVMQKLDWLGAFSQEAIGLEDSTPAQILQHLLEQKWALEPDDKDMIVMWHKFLYHANGKNTELQASLVVEGVDETETAMARTVGLPIAIAVKLVLNGNWTMSGVQLPLAPEIYDPVLDELGSLGISFTERSSDPVRS